MKSPTLEGAGETLKRNGKSFWFASLFLPRQIAKDAAALYAFCRQVDDLADLPSDESPTARLEQVRADLRRGVSADPMLKELLRLRSQRGLDLGAAEDLVNALLRDAAGGTLIPDEAALVRYCYAVAGTVGLMMSAVLGVETAEARLQAIDLGIAMQLTNIARDVAEDAGMGRRYLPGTWVEDLPPEQIAHRSLQSEEAHARLVAAIERILQLADVFYGNASKGFPAIPASARNGIRIAAAVYREIGVELRRRGCDPNSGRVIISKFTKARIAISVYTGRSKLETLPAENTAHLHTSLAGLPGIV